MKLNDGKPVTISTEQTEVGGVTKAIVTVKNNSLVYVASGNLIVKLLDKNGKVIESLQSYDKLIENNGFISLMGEETTQRTFEFSQKGSSLAVSYSNAILDRPNNANLTDITLDGIPLQFEAGKTSYFIDAVDIKETIITSIQEDPNATIRINGVEGTFGTSKIKLNYGSNLIRIVVTAADGVTTKIYTVVINNKNPSQRSNEENQNKEAAVFSPRITAKNGTATLTISDSDIESLINKAKGMDTNRIVISPIVSGDAKQVLFELSGPAVLAIMEAGIEVRLDTLMFKLKLSTNALEDIARVGGNEIAISIGQENDIYRVEISRDGVALNNINGGITAFVPQSDLGSGVVAALVKNLQISDIIRMSFYKDEEMVVPLVGSASFKFINNAKSFIDTKGYGSYIDFVSARCLFNGTKPDTFGPISSMNRGMVVTILGRLGEVDQSGFTESKFTDVNSNNYYSPYIAWAAQNGIIQGLGGNRFLPDKPITREQLATIFANYIEATNIKLYDIKSDTEDFEDYKDISDYAKNAVMEMKNAGIIYGKGNNSFDPKGTATRAEVAIMLERLVKGIVR
ncbi:MAG: S-layer homology domain-containing protein [Clostridia bacterium]|nr:S-layer homology domain-containing protein [Clostridia bacterium]